MTTVWNCHILNLNPNPDRSGSYDGVCMNCIGTMEPPAGDLVISNHSTWQT